MKRWLKAPKHPQMWVPLDETIASAALLLMVLIPVLEIMMRPWMGSGIENAPVLVQHLGLVLTMFGALAAERYGHLTTLGGSGLTDKNAPKPLAYAVGNALAALVCGMLAMSSWFLVASEREVSQVLTYGIPTWWVQASMPLGFALLGFKLGARCASSTSLRGLWGVLLPLCGSALVAQFDGTGLPLWP